MRSHWTGIALALLVWFSMLEHRDCGAANRIDVSYIPSDCFFAIVVHPARILQRPPRDREARDFLLKMLRDESGIDARNVKQWVIHCGSRSSQQDELGLGNEFAMICHFDKPVDREAILAKAFPGKTEGIHRGAVYYRSGSDYEPSIYFPDEKTMVVALENRLKALINEKISMSLLVHRLRTAETEADLHVVMTASTAREIVADFLSDIPLGASLRGLNLDQQLQVFSLSADLSNDVPVQLHVTMNNVQSANQLKTVGESLLKMAQSYLTNSRQKMIDDAPTKQLGEMACELCEQTLAGTTITVSGRQVVVRLEVEGGIPSLSDLVAESMASELRELEQEIVIELNGEAPDLIEDPGDAPPSRIAP